MHTYPAVGRAQPPGCPPGQDESPDWESGLWIWPKGLLLKGWLSMSN